VASAVEPSATAVAIIITLPVRESRRGSRKTHPDRLQTHSHQDPMGRQAIDDTAQSGILPQCTGAPSTRLRPQDATAARVRGVAPQNMENEMTDQASRGNACALEIFFNDRTSAGKIAGEYPLGHRRRCAEGIPLLETEFLNALRTRFPESHAKHVHDVCLNAERLQLTSVNAFARLLAI
jgi:hypothetical protein